LKPPASILVARGGAIGDFILTLPVLAALRRRFPGARLDVLGSPHIAGLAVASGLADAVLSLESRPLASFFSPAGPLDAALAAALARYGLVVSYLNDPQNVFAANLRRCTPAPILRGPPRPDPAAGLHATDALLEPLKSIGIDSPDPVPQLRLPPPPGASTQPLEPRLAIHPGSGSEAKNWPVSRWAQLLPRLARACDWGLLLVAGEVEGDRLARLAPLWPAHRCAVAQGLPLVELAGRLQNCRFFLGHDSGITHLAAALGLPGLALWGPTPPELWRPRSDGFHILRAPALRTGLGIPLGEVRGMSGLEVNRVLAAVLAELGDRRGPPSLDRRSGHGR
jgi:ADP-heptose:LPS heptosyltransferase